MHLGPQLKLLIGTLLIIGAAVFVALRFEVTTSITHFLPADADTRLVTISRAVADSELARTVVLTVGAADEARAAQAATELADLLRRSPRVAWVQNGVNADLQKAVHQLYNPRRLMFLTDRPDEELAQRLSDQGLRDAASELKRQLLLPTAPMIRRLAPADPFLAFPQLLDRLEQAQAGTLELRGGQFVTAEEGRGVVLLGSEQSAFDSAAQRALQRDIQTAFAEVRQRHGDDLDLDQSGAGRFAIAAEAAIKQDITRISIASTLGIILLFLGLFRSPRALGLVLLPLFAGVVGAAAVGLLVFGRLHGLTLAFGSTLIGVCIDYAVHLQSHHALEPHPDGAEATLRRIWSALVIGALTTVVGLAGLAWTSLPGIREIALFATVGVVLALLTTRALLPPLLPNKALPSTALLARFSRALGRLLGAMQAHRRALLLLPAAALAICAVAVPGLRWDDDVSALQPLNPELRAEEDRVRAQISRMESGRFVVAVADTEEEALQRNDQLFHALRRAQEDGHLGDFRSLHPLLPAAELQRENLETLQQAPELRRRLSGALQAEGFRAELFTPFFEALVNEDVAPLTYGDLSQSPLADLVRPFRIAIGDQVAILTFLREVRDEEALEQALEGLDGVTYFDQMSFLRQTYRHARTRTIQFMLVGLLGVFLLVFLRYRALGLTLAAVIPSLIAAATALAIVSLLGQAATLLHLVGLLLVLSMGVDYGVFMVESRNEEGQLRATAVGLVVACLSTVFAFGLLAFSANPALSAVGLTTGIGVLLSLVLAPTALALLRRS